MQLDNAEEKRQVVDPAVSQQKFDKELQIFIENQDFQRRRGVLLLKAEFPNIYLAFAAPRLSPSAIVFAVKVNFDNYDLEPLSLTFVNPFTHQPASLQEIHTPFLRKLTNPQGHLEPQALLQAEENGVPFLCLPGTREYHNHPSHTGDPWLLHRNLGGEGTLGFLIDKLYEYGITAVQAYRVQVQVLVDANSLQLGFNAANLPQ